ncbi:DUF4113 domain-containing protein [Jeongeupia chitinilytica]|uniref:DUF4113 domain-containing protein n=1 Tax=Jeongeupia chitinilytica TaxID=1041641 RepID=A0ABQ3H3H8_9NEIS|nr:DUF4113 domain-containing protein [Jeongeupia chitinilytica]GHD68573.1 hypothetical protein GCM10007350_34190 [Jeongeupia chitinilytica]
MINQANRRYGRGSLTLASALDDKGWKMKQGKVSPHWTMVCAGVPWRARGCIGLLVCLVKAIADETVA